MRIILDPTGSMIGDPERVTVETETPSATVRFPLDGPGGRFLDVTLTTEGFFEIRGGAGHLVLRPQSSNVLHVEVMGYW